MGESPRSLGLLNYLRIKAWAPRWVHYDKMKIIYRYQRRLLKRGHIVWAHIVQANSLLFKPGSEDCPANVVYGTSAELDNRLDLLADIAHGLFSLKKTHPDDRELRRFADSITDELERSMRMAVPKSLTEGLNVFMTSIMVPRKHLPNGYLSQSFFPLLILPRVTEATMIVPCEFWSEELMRHW